MHASALTAEPKGGFYPKMKQLKYQKLFLPVLLLLSGLLLLTGCSNGKKITKNFALSQTQASMMEGETVSISLTDLEKKKIGEYTVSWSSENEAIAAVDETGTITGVSVGTTTVSATVKTKKAEVAFPCTITVTKNTTPLSSIAFAASIYSLGEGQTLNLYDEAVFYPANAANKTLTWTSSNPSIASIQNGVVTPVSEGITTITATTPDGNISASCTVRVSKIAIPATGIAFNQESYNLTTGRTLTLTAKVTPENATGYSIIWSSSDPTVATVSAGVVTGISAGTATITARLNVSGTNLTAECQITVEGESNVSVPATRVEITPSSYTISEEDEGPFKFTTKIYPVNCTEQTHWLTTRDDLIEIDPDTGEFTVLNFPTDKQVSVVVSCVVGDIISEAVVNLKPIKPKLQIIAENIEIYDKEPKNTATLDVAFANSSEIPNVTWESSDSTVATVSKDGTVTAKKSGSCKIIATCKDDPSRTATITITVKKADFVTVRVGETISINPDLLPEEIESWLNLGEEFLTLNEADREITGKKKNDEPSIIVIISKTTGAKNLLVYILPKESQ